MIYSLKGKIERIDDNTLVVDTGAVSFEVTVSTFSALYFSGSNEEQKVYTYMQVLDDDIKLFGFKDKREKEMFNNLLLVSGVGPKMAITVLSGLSPDDIVKAVINSDVKTLSSVKGLGKKTAERIVLELSAKLGASSALENIISSSDAAMFKETLPKAVEEAIDVLVSTGIQKSVATELAKTNYEKDMTGEQLVMKCFKNLK